MALGATSITITGNLTGDPELRYTPKGIPVATFTVAATERTRDESGQWQDSGALFLRVNVWRDLAEHVAESVVKGDRVIVTGALKQRSYEASDGTNRTVYEIQGDEVAASMRFANVKITKTKRSGGPAPEDPWRTEPAASDATPDEPPF